MSAAVLPVALVATAMAYTVYSMSSAVAETAQVAAPVTQVAAPVAQVAAPVAQVAAPVAQVKNTDLAEVQKCLVELNVERYPCLQGLREEVARLSNQEYEDSPDVLKDLVFKAFSVKCLQQIEERYNNLDADGKAKFDGLRTLDKVLAQLKLQGSVDQKGICEGMREAIRSFRHDWVELTKIEKEVVPTAQRPGPEAAPAPVVQVMRTTDRTGDAAKSQEITSDEAATEGADMSPEQKCLEDLNDEKRFPGLSDLKSGLTNAYPSEQNDKLLSSFSKQVADLLYVHLRIPPPGISVENNTAWSELRARVKNGYQYRPFCNIIKAYVRYWGDMDTILNSVVASDAVGTWCTQMKTELNTSNPDNNASSFRTILVQKLIEIVGLMEAKSSTIVDFSTELAKWDEDHLDKIQRLYTICDKLEFSDYIQVVQGVRTQATQIRIGFDESKDSHEPIGRATELVTASIDLATKLQTISDTVTDKIRTLCPELTEKLSDDMAGLLHYDDQEFTQAVEDMKTKVIECRRQAEAKADPRIVALGTELDTLESDARFNSFSGLLGQWRADAAKVQTKTEVDEFFEQKERDKTDAQKEEGIHREQIDTLCTICTELGFQALCTKLKEELHAALNLHQTSALAGIAIVTFSSLATTAMLSRSIKSSSNELNEEIKTLAQDCPENAATLTDGMTALLQQFDEVPFTPETIVDTLLPTLTKTVEDCENQQLVSDAPTDGRTDDPSGLSDGSVTDQSEVILKDAKWVRDATRHANVTGWSDLNEAVEAKPQVDDALRASTEEVLKSYTAKAYVWLDTIEPPTTPQERAPLTDGYPDQFARLEKIVDDKVAEYKTRTFATCASTLKDLFVAQLDPSVADPSSETVEQQFKRVEETANGVDQHLNNNVLSNSQSTVDDFIVAKTAHEDAWHEFRKSIVENLDARAAVQSPCTESQPPDVQWSNAVAAAKTVVEDVGDAEAVEKYSDAVVQLESTYAKCIIVDLTSFARDQVDDGIRSGLQEKLKEVESMVLPTPSVARRLEIEVLEYLQNEVDKIYSQPVTGGKMLLGDSPKLDDRRDFAAVVEDLKEQKSTLYRKLREKSALALKAVLQRITPEQPAAASQSGGEAGNESVVVDVLAAAVENALVIENDPDRTEAEYEQDMAIAYNRILKAFMDKFGIIATNLRELQAALGSSDILPVNPNVSDQSHEPSLAAELESIATLATDSRSWIVLVEPRVQHWIDDATSVTRATILLAGANYYENTASLPENLKTLYKTFVSSSHGTALDSTDDIGTLMDCVQAGDKLVKDVTAFCDTFGELKAKLPMVWARTVRDRASAIIDFIKKALYEKQSSRISGTYEEAFELNSTLNQLMLQKPRVSAPVLTEATDALDMAIMKLLDKYEAERIKDWQKDKAIESVPTQASAGTDAAAVSPVVAGGAWNSAPEPPWPRLAPPPFPCVDHTLTAAMEKQTAQVKKTNRSVYLKVADTVTKAPTQISLFDKFKEELQVSYSLTYCANVSDKVVHARKMFDDAAKNRVVDRGALTDLRHENISRWVAGVLNVLESYSEAQKLFKRSSSPTTPQTRPHAYQQDLTIRKRLTKWVNSIKDARKAIELGTLPDGVGNDIAYRRSEPSEMAISAELSTVLAETSAEAPTPPQIIPQENVGIDQMYKPDRAAINLMNASISRGGEVESKLLKMYRIIWHDAFLTGDAPNEKDLNRVAEFLNDRIRGGFKLSLAEYFRVLCEDLCALTKLIRMNAIRIEVAVDIVRGERSAAKLEGTDPKTESVKDAYDVAKLKARTCMLWPYLPDTLNIAFSQKHLAHAIDKVENHTKAAGEKDVRQLDEDFREAVDTMVDSFEKRLTDSRTYESVTRKRVLKWLQDEQAKKQVKAKEDATRAPVVTVEAEASRASRAARAARAASNAFRTAATATGALIRRKPQPDVDVPQGEVNVEELFISNSGGGIDDTVSMLQAGGLVVLTVLATVLGSR
jgi:phage pi2 protein 07